MQKVRRKRRLERELFHQYSYPNSEADDMEERNIGDVESVINAQFVCINSDRSDKNLYCLLYTSPSPRDRQKSRMPSSA